MNLDRYEKIDGREALRRLVDGETVLNGFNETHLLDGTRLVFIRKSGAYETVNDGLKQILETTWYIPKPFDVRQAMFDRPNEWVGAFLRDDDEWMAIGFDTEEFEVSTIQIQSVGVASPKESMLCEMLESSRYLDRCIPLEDAPKEATR